MKAWRPTGVSTAALVVNRVHPRFGDETADHVSAPAGSDLAVLVDNLGRLDATADREQATYAELVREVAPSPVGRVPLLGSDVHDLEALGTVADHLFGARPA